MSARKRPRKERDLSKAITLRPVEVFQLYGITQPTLHRLCKHDDPLKRLPSVLLKSKGGRKGVRLINHAELKAFLARHSTANAA